MAQGTQTMMSLWPLWVAIALPVCWAVGAYQRLVRLRARVVRAFALLDAQLVRQLDWVQASLPPPLRGVVPAQPVPGDAVHVAWSRLRQASEELVQALAAARPRVFDPEALTALTAARAAMNNAWLQVHGLRRGWAADELHAQHERLLAQILPLCDDFNQAGRAYNEAIGQLPARLLATLLGFRPTGCVQPMALVA